MRFACTFQGDLALIFYAYAFRSNTRRAETFHFDIWSSSIVTPRLSAIFPCREESLPAAVFVSWAFFAIEKTLRSSIANRKEKTASDAGCRELLFLTVPLEKHNTFLRQCCREEFLLYKVTLSWNSDFHPTH